jgi:uncharacterized membrane protein YkvA (DUF1232 family)
LWSKLAQIAQKAGDKIVVTALILFHCLQDKDTPAWARTVIIGALGYLILPADMVPDIIPGAGLTDDWGALVAALGTISMYIKDLADDTSHWAKAARSQPMIVTVLIFAVVIIGMAVFQVLFIHL